MNEIVVVSNSRIEQIKTELAHDPQLPSRNTLRGYLCDLRKFEEWREQRDFTALLVEEYMTELQRREYSPNSINRTLSSIKWFARRVKKVTFSSSVTDDFRKTVAENMAEIVAIRGVRGKRPHKGRHIPDNEVRKLSGVCLSDPKHGKRDWAAVALAYITGMRRFELCGIELSDIEWDGSDAQITVRHGKGNKTRTAYVYNDAASAVRRWLDMRGDAPGPLFCPINKSGAIGVGRKLSETSMERILAGRSLQAGVDFNWHDFRRTFAGNLLNSGADLSIVQKLMGHESPKTTSNYDMRGEETLKNAAKKIAIPL